MTVEELFLELSRLIAHGDGASALEIVVSVPDGHTPTSVLVSEIGDRREVVLA